ncbi:MAG: carbon-nitrogen hydrolase family protein [Planctomycetota bacterium]|nr:carbon-nitrogen hydrolase family protein [Planctomycetota bacterium]MDA1142593.1 carbon-nitrogen hydrolase family protein [Planctomycetota bacterium]
MTRTAAAQINIEFKNPSANRKKMEEWLRRAHRKGAQLIVFPEACLSGYCFEEKEDALQFTEPIPGPTTAMLCSLCSELGVWVVFGMLELDGDKIFNSAPLIGPEGLVGVYRKVHLPFLGVDRFTTPGDRPFEVFGTPIGNIGINICYDAAFPESARVLALQGADLIVLPTNWPGKAICYSEHVIATRCLENRINYVACDRVGEEGGTKFIGNSVIYDYAANELARAGADEEELIFADLDVEAPRQKRLVYIPGVYELDRIGDRRPELYGRISS